MSSPHLGLSPGVGLVEVVSHCTGKQCEHKTSVYITSAHANVYTGQALKVEAKSANHERAGSLVLDVNNPTLLLAHLGIAWYCCFQCSFVASYLFWTLNPKTLNRVMGSRSNLACCHRS